MDFDKFTFAIDAIHAARLTAIKKKNARGMADHTRELKNSGMGSHEARLLTRRMRSESWPTLSDIVARAIRQRLEEEDLAGPWAPLTQEEREVASLSGRGFGRNYPGVLVSRTYELPISLVEELRTASIRVSEEPLAKLDELGLTYNSLDYTVEEQEERDQLIELVFSAPRVVRQGLERYGPWPREEYPPSAPPLPVRE